MNRDSIFLQTKQILLSYGTIKNEGIPSVLMQMSRGSGTPFISMSGNRSNYHAFDPIIACIQHEADLKAFFSLASSVLAKVEAPYQDVLKAFYCDNKRLSVALKKAKTSNALAFEYALALFAFHHPHIEFTNDDLKEFCAALKNKEIEAINSSARFLTSFNEFKELLEAHPEQYSASINNLPPVASDAENSAFLAPCPSGDKSFYRKKNTLLLAAYLVTFPDVDADLVLDAGFKLQASKKYLKKISREIQEDF